MSRYLDGSPYSRDEIIALLFGAAMSGNPEKFARDNELDLTILRMWKSRYIIDYANYMEAVLYRIKDQIDD